MTMIINLTPHTVTIVDDAGGNLVTIEPSPLGPARVTMLPDQQYGHAAYGDMRVPLVISSTSRVIENLPDPVPGRLIIVSRMVVEAAAGRADLVVPHDTVRDERGQVVACRSLARPFAGDDALLHFHYFGVTTAADGDEGSASYISRGVAIDGGAVSFVRGWPAWDLLVQDLSADAIAIVGVSGASPHELAISSRFSHEGDGSDEDPTTSTIVTARTCHRACVIGIRPIPIDGPLA
jgi:hypothetical protein